jgi:H+-translocating NAD(P) transhydrogenase subunit beta
VGSSAEELLYLLAAVPFIVGLKWLNKPDTARRGNLVSGIGMAIAIVVTLVDRAIVSYAVVAAGIVVGSALGLWMARAVKMTQMPQMVALLNGFGGAASFVVSGAEFLRAASLGERVAIGTGISIQLGTLIGAVTFTGSVVAFAKLQELMPGKPISFPGQNIVNLLVFLAVLALGIYQVATPQPLLWVFYLTSLLALVLGVMLAIPIGGADMPVVISLLNSYSGLAAAMTGFVIGNSVLIIAGALVGSSGIILSQMMCKAMNRSLANVLFGAFGTHASGSSKSAVGLTARSITAEDVAIQLVFARSVIIVPGYGMAVAQSQHQLRELAEMLERRGAEVRYAIHPVAGRMPGHMNVLLAEANVPYDRLITDIEDANSALMHADAALVIGANDVVNPAARTDPSSPIYGMPILNADAARQVIVLKRGMAAGFAGIENELFYDAKTAMLFGDAKTSLQAMIAEVKQM